MSERVALVTGATGGIGRATVAQLLGDGFSVVAAGTNAERVAKLCSGDERLHGVVADIRQVAECERVVAEAVAWKGRLHLLVNNAGVWEGGPSDQVSEHVWDRILDVNLKGAFFLCRYAIPHLELVGGSIVNVSSDAGLVGNAESAAYCASKGGLTVMTKALAVELAARGIRVNAVCPVEVDTPMMERALADEPDADAAKRETLSHYPQGDHARFVEAAEVAALIGFLARPEAAPITGAAVPIDFGVTAGY